MLCCAAFLLLPALLLKLRSISLALRLLWDENDRSVAAELIGAPLVPGRGPGLWRAPFHFSHGAGAFGGIAVAGASRRHPSNHLGAGMVYYALAYMLRPEVCVVIGSGGGFVPALVRRGQADGGAGAGRTFFIDLQVDTDNGKAMFEVPMEITPDFFAAFPEVEFLRMPSVPDGAHVLGNRSVRVDFLFVDGDHTYEGVRADLEGFAPLLSPLAVVVLHDSECSGYNSCGGTRQVVKELRGDPCWDMVDIPLSWLSLPALSSSFAILRHRCGPEAGPGAEASAQEEA